MNKWISVKDRMPEETKSGASKMVTVTFKDLETRRSFVSKDFTMNGQWVNHGRSYQKVTAWMPLEPYKEGE